MAVTVTIVVMSIIGVMVSIIVMVRAVMIAVMVVMIEMITMVVSVVKKLTVAIYPRMIPTRCLSGKYNLQKKKCRSPTITTVYEQSIVVGALDKDSSGQGSRSRRRRDRLSLKIL